MTSLAAASSPATALAHGYGAMAAAIALFGGVFYLSGVTAVGAETVVAWRVVVTFGCYLVLLSHPRPRATALDYGRALRRTRWHPLLLVLLSGLVGLQLWLFSWAPQHGHALDASLGFLLLPIALVAATRLVLRSPITAMQRLATGVAAFAVGVQLALAPQLSWVTFAICIGYPTYFVLRRHFKLDNPMAFGAEVAVLSPICLVFIVTGRSDQPADATELAVLLAVGLAGAGAMALFLSASRLLPLPLFGLLAYMEPVALVLISLLLGERPRGSDLMTYGLLALALSLLAIEGARLPRRPAGADSRSAREERSVDGHG